MQRLRIKRTMARVAMLLIMMLTTASAWASIKTVTYTYTDQMRTQGRLYLTFTATGDVNASYQVEVTGAEHSASFTLGDIHVSWASNDTYFACGNFGGWVISGTASYPNWTFTISCDNYYIDNVKYYNQRNELRREQANDTKSCAITTNNQAFGGTAFGIHSFTVTMSDTPAYKLHYMVDGSEVSGHGNPAYYESATGATLTNLSKTGYTFDGWYDNDGYTGSTISSIAAGTTGEKTFYAQWGLITYNITYEKNGGHFQGIYTLKTSYNITTNTFDLLTPARDGYYFRGWYEDEDFAGRAVTQIKQGSTGDRTFYAKWEQWETQGNGTKWNPYKISSEADLRALATKVNGGDECEGVYYQQTCDITITGGDWIPIGNRDNCFVGNYDGGNYTISGININSTSDRQGLFGYVAGTPDQKWGFIQNIILENSTIAGGSYTGGIVGCVVNAHVHNCHVRSSVTVQAGADGADKFDKKFGFGGVVGYFHNGTVKGCTSMATVNDGGHANVKNFGGVIGHMKQITYTATATNCYSHGVNPIGKTESGTATNVERVYRMRCTDGSVSLPDEVSATDGFYYNGRGYYKAGVTIPLTITIGEPPVGYDIVVTHTGNNVITPNEDGEYVYTVGTVNKAFSATTHVSPLLGWTSSYTPDGTTNPYIINNTDGWDLLCDALQDNTTWNRFDGKTVRLDDDISVIRMAGSSDHEFMGTFHGGGHTLTVSYENTDNNEKTAPFSYVNGATIRNLIVGGTITGTAYRAAGVVGETGTNLSHITNCMSSVDISSGRYTGGFSIGGNVAIEGCVFNGKIVGTEYSGGFVGYSNSALKITNSLFDPQDGSSISGGTFYYNGGGSATMTNCYYTRTLGDAQGNAASSSATLPANIGTVGTAYSVSGITPYTHGIAYDNRYYMTPEALSFVDNTANDVAAIDGYFATVTLSGRTLYKDGDWNTLCLPFGVTIANSPLAGDNVVAMTLNTTTSGLSGTTLTLNFENALETIPAGTPFIIKWATKDAPATDLVNPVFSSVVINSTPTAVTSTDGKVSFKGTYSPVEWDTENKSILFVGANNKLYYPQPSGGQNPYLNAFRCYFELSDGSQAREFVLNFDDGEATGIKTTNSTNYTNSDAWYDMSGRKLSGKPTKAGLYIHGNRKVSIK